MVKKHLRQQNEIYRKKHGCKLHTSGIIAAGGKLLVESSSMPQEQKEYAKLGIDCLAELIKRFNVPPQVSFSVMGYSLDQIYVLKVAAKECKLTKVILFPCPVNGLFVPCLKMEGGDLPAFYHAAGLTPPQNININATETERAELIRRYGVIVYSGEN